MLAVPVTSTFDESRWIQMNPSVNRVFSRPDYLLAFGFGSGLVPKAPGTAGSLLALLIAVPFLHLPYWILIGIILLSLVLGILITGGVAEELGLKDPGGIVWDEFVGMWIALLWLPSWWWLIPAFLLFRLFDIVKPWPVSLADRELTGGAGIMLDDVIAGLYALGVLQLANYIVVQYLSELL